MKAYDKELAKIRNVDEAFDEIINETGLGKDHTVIDMGCGTGEFTLKLAEHCKHVYAIDVSETMIDYAKNKISKNNISNVTFINDGFLTYDHKDEPVDCIVSQYALHHLPDFWKQIALKNLNTCLAKDGILYLKDIVFSIKMGKHEKTIDYAVENFKQTAGEKMSEEFITHVKEEFSTYDWIMEEMLYRTGFEILNADYGENFITLYTCKKGEIK